MIDKNDPTYRPSLAYFRRNVTEKDVLTVVCGVMIFLCLAVIAGSVQ
jgi:hypothetical protein